jgi:NAD(P)-dependent dehydrogenase (short-subunit alcohol dehydrogenase family)
MSGSVSKAVLITGCSSGIGEATARRLAGHGWTVYASARRSAGAPAGSAPRRRQRLVIWRRLRATGSNGLTTDRV